MSEIPSPEQLSPEQQHISDEFANEMQKHAEQWADLIKQPVEKAWKQKMDLAGDYKIHAGIPANLEPQNPSAEPRSPGYFLTLEGYRIDTEAGDRRIGREDYFLFQNSSENNYLRTRSGGEVLSVVFSSTQAPHHATSVGMGVIVQYPGERLPSATAIEIITSINGERIFRTSEGRMPEGELSDCLDHLDAAIRFFAA